MPMNRIQFQPGMSLPEFFRCFGTEAQSEAALEQARWPEGFLCPRCGGVGHCVMHSRGRKTFQCNHCHHQTSLGYRHPVRGCETGATRLVSGDLSRQSRENRRVSLGVEAETRSELSYLMADSLQADAGYGRTRPRLPPMQPHPTRRLLSGGRAQRRHGRARF